jgi:hypothetical protein
MIKSKSCVTRVFDALPKHAFRRKCGICVSNLLRFNKNKKKFPSSPSGAILASTGNF